MRIGDWSSDVCSSDLIIETAAKILPVAAHRQRRHPDRAAEIEGEHLAGLIAAELHGDQREQHRFAGAGRSDDQGMADVADMQREAERRRSSSEEHTSELQSLMRTSSAVFCLQTKKLTHQITPTI